MYIIINDVFGDDVDFDDFFSDDVIGDDKFRMKLNLLMEVDIWEFSSFLYCFVFCMVY